jgi:hypothetical protein
MQTAPCPSFSPALSYVTSTEGSSHIHVIFLGPVVQVRMRTEPFRESEGEWITANQDGEENGAGVHERTKG